MKTAMQELIDLMKTHKKRGWSSMTYDFFFAQVEEIKALEKEKEQIMKDWEKGYSTGCVVGGNDYTNEDEQKDNGNYYYNQTYNN
tara:strand:+ start:264 stop:518 length:255 start_codon:yes stop_codon:yes gene_type:complete